MTPSERRETEAAMLAVEAMGRKRLRAAIKAIVAHHVSKAGNGDPLVVAMDIGKDIAIAARPIVDDVRIQAGEAGRTRLLAELRIVDSALKDWEDSHTWDEKPEKHRSIIPLLILGSGASNLNHSASKRVGFKSSQELAQGIGDTFVLRAVRALRKRDQADAKEAANDVAASTGTSSGTELVAGPYRKPGHADIYAEAETSAISKADTVAATEGAAEFNIARDAVSEQIETPQIISLEKEWSAILDRAVCPVCAALDGRRIPRNQSSWAGYSPGNVHPRCRCTWFYVWSFSSVRKAA